MVADQTAKRTAGIILFSGPGGVCQGLRDAGVVDAVGIEYEANAVATARAAGHDSILEDVCKVNPSQVRARLLGRSLWEYLLLQSSPPCQGLSPAGTGAGREDLERLLYAVAQVERNHASAKMWSNWLVQECSDERSPLTFEVLRWVVATKPDFVMLEQVTTALTIWQAIAVKLQAWGYSTWTANVNAEQYGVPQARRRAMMLASLHGEVTPPVPTHSLYHRRSPQRLDPGVPRWVSMSEGLGPDWVPTPAIEGETLEDVTWVESRPSPTIVASFAPDVVAKPGYRRAGDPPRQRTPGSVRVTVEEAGVLQSFPRHYPWQGSEGRQYQQVGNAVPPLLQRALTSHLLACASVSSGDVEVVA